MNNLTAFLNCNVLDVTTGNVTSSIDVVVEGGIIVAAGKGVGFEAAFKVDTSGLWAIPGLIDVHVHVCGYQSEVVENVQEDEAVSLLRSLRNLSEALRCGITTVRDTGSIRARSLVVKRAIESGAVVGPTVYSCGEIITYPQGHMSDYGIEVRGKEDIKKAINRNIAIGADFIKVTSDPEDNEAKGRTPDPTLTLEELRDIVIYSKRHNLKVACHTYPSVVGIQRAVDAGINTIEHAVPLEGVVLPENYRDQITFVPTFVSAYDAMPTDTITSKMTLDRKKGKLFDATNAKVIFEDVPASISKWFNRLTKNVPIAIAAGTRIAIGSDAGCVGTNFKSAIREMYLLTQLGASNLQVLQYATVNGAEALGDGLIGRLEVGCHADIVFCKANPIADIEGLLKVKIVVSKGAIVNVEQ